MTIVHPEPPASTSADSDEQEPLQLRGMRLLLRGSRVLDTVIVAGSLELAEDRETGLLSRLHWTFRDEHGPQLRYVDASEVVAVVTFGLDEQPPSAEEILQATEPGGPGWPGAEEFGQELRRYRLQRELLQADVAEHMRNQGFPYWQRSTVSTSEKGKRRMLLAEAAELARLFQVDVNELLAGAANSAPTSAEGDRG